MVTPTQPRTAPWRRCHGNSFFPCRTRSPSQPPPTGTSRLTQMSAVLSDSTWNHAETLVTVGNLSLWWFFCFFYTLPSTWPDIPDILRCAAPFPGSTVSYGTQCRVETILWNLPPQQWCSGQPLSKRRQLSWRLAEFMLMQEVRHNVQVRGTCRCMRVNTQPAKASIKFNLMFYFIT